MRRRYSFVCCEKLTLQDHTRIKNPAFLENFAKEFSNSSDNDSNNNCGNIKIMIITTTIIIVTITIIIIIIITAKLHFYKFWHAVRCRINHLKSKSRNVVSKKMSVIMQS